MPHFRRDAAGCFAVPKPNVPTGTGVTSTTQPRSTITMIIIGWPGRLYQKIRSGTRQFVGGSAEFSSAMILAGSASPQIRFDRERARSCISVHASWFGKQLTVALAGGSVAHADNRTAVPRTTIIRKGMRASWVVSQPVSAEAE